MLVFFEGSQADGGASWFRLRGVVGAALFARPRCEAVTGPIGGAHRTLCAFVSRARWSPGGLQGPSTSIKTACPGGKPEPVKAIGFPEI